MTADVGEGNLLTLRESGSSALVFVHPASGMATAFRRLPAHLDGDYSLVAFENAGPVGTGLCSVGRLSAAYAAELLAREFDHVVLAGWSFGGAVAVELAALLEAAGRAVAGVVLIDSASPDVLAASERTFAGELAGLFEFSPLEARGLESVSSEEEVWTAVLRVLRARYGLPSLTRDDLQPFLDAYSWHLKALRAPWTPPRLRLPVFQIRAQHETGWGDAPTDLGWAASLDALVQPAESPGNHYSMLSSDNAAVFADVLTSCLKRLAWPK